MWPLPRAAVRACARSEPSLTDERAAVSSCKECRGDSMTAQLWATFLASFLASAVEFVEAFTIVLVVGVTINWRSSLLGAFAAAATLAVIVATLGVALVKWVPINDFRLAVGIILILFGLKWLKKAIL